VTLDMLGHGKSTLPPADPLLSDYAEQVRSLMDALGIARAHVAGHSMGALISLELALAYPQRVISLAPLAGVYCRSQAAQKAVEARASALEGATGPTSPDQTLERWFGNPVPHHLAQAAEITRSMLLNVDPVGYARTYRTFANSHRRHEGRLRGLVPPALFMTAEFDPNSTPAMSQAMADAAPKGRCKILPGERHMMTITAPALVTEELRSFFAEVDETVAY
jgi:pimeloyl-ACP methyl ester carboxylesterase